MKLLYLLCFHIYFVTQNPDHSARDTPILKILKPLWCDKIVYAEIYCGFTDIPIYNVVTSKRTVNLIWNHPRGLVVYGSS